MNLKPQDILVLLKIVVWPRKVPYAQLASDLHMSPSEVHAAVRRADSASLIDAKTRHLRRKPLTEFVIHGLKYAFPAHRGPVTRGMPTSYAAPVLSGHLVRQDDIPPVWPDVKSRIRGLELTPLYRSVPLAAKDDAELYALLALIDAVRTGRARERDLASKELSMRLAAHA